jgi:hypothetical protein
LLTNINALTAELATMVPGGFGAAIAILLPMLIGGVCLVIFPLDWALIYRPDNISLILGLMLPWAVAGLLVALIFAHNAKEGFICGLSIAVYPIILGIVATVGLGFLGNAISIDIGTILNGLVEGLVDRGLILAILSATLEGGALAGVFGALIGSLKYKPGQVEKAKKSKKSKAKSKEKGKEEPRVEGKKEEDFFVDFE